MAAAANSVDGVMIVFEAWKRETEESARRVLLYEVVINWLVVVDRQFSLSSTWACTVHSSGNLTRHTVALRFAVLLRCC